MRVLVTGARGQLGRVLVERLQSSHAVIGADRATLDLTQLDKIPIFLERLAPELIVNCAAYTAVDRAEDEVELAMTVNAHAPGAIARWAAARAVPLLHFSTDYVFDGAGDQPWREDDAARPLSAYGASKLAGETQIRAAGGCHLIMRTSWVYAAHGTNFPTAIARAATERAELRVVDDQIGAPTSAAMLGAAVGDILTSGMAKLQERCAQAGGLVHIAAEGETSWHGFATAIVTGLKARGMVLVTERIVPIPSDQYPAKARRPCNSRLDLTRLRRVFGWTPEPWRDALNPVLDRLAGVAR